MSPQRRVSTTLPASTTILGLPARHDVARRMDCAFLAKLVVEHRLDEDEGFELAHDLTYQLVRSAYKL
jgi:glucuronate isomerase